jgi:hypothetical protein
MLFSILMGTFLISLGISIILKTFFKIEVPVIKPFMAGILILMGISMITETIFHKRIFITFNY